MEVIVCVSSIILMIWLTNSALLVREHAILAPVLLLVIVVIVRCLGRRIQIRTCVSARLVTLMMGAIGSVSYVRILVWSVLIQLSVLTVMQHCSENLTQQLTILESVIHIVLVCIGITVHHKMLLASLVIILVRFVLVQVRMSVLFAIRQPIGLSHQIISVYVRMGIMKMECKTALLVTGTVHYALVLLSLNVLNARQIYTYWILLVILSVLCFISVLMLLWLARHVVNIVRFVIIRPIAPNVRMGFPCIRMNAMMSVQRWHIWIQGRMLVMIVQLVVRTVLLILSVVAALMIIILISLWSYALTVMSIARVALDQAWISVKIVNILSSSESTNASI